MFVSGFVIKLANKYYKVIPKHQKPKKIIETPFIDWDIINGLKKIEDDVCKKKIKDRMERLF